MTDRVIAPIARVKNNFNTKFGLPRQSGLAPIKAEIIFEKSFSPPEAFRGIEQFTHLWIIWGFERKGEEKFSPTVRPPMLGGNERVGVFATRSPNRPNGLGLSVVKLEKFEIRDGSAVLTVTGVDFMDGTVVYDVKPYLAYVDSVEGANSGFAEKKESYAIAVEFLEEAERELSKEEINELRLALSRDPRPQYHEGERVYGFEFADKEIKIKRSEDKLTVLSVEAKNE